MKKRLYFVLCLCVIFLLTACHREGPIGSEPSNTENNTKVSCNEALTLDCQIKQAYLDKTKEEVPHNEMSVRYVYHFEDAYAVFVECSLWVAGEAITNVQVGNYLFTFPTTQEMLIYKDGVIYKLTEAYDQKLLTEEQWKTLCDTWMGENPHLYADVFDKDDLFAIMDEAGELLHRGSYTIENPSSFVQYFFSTNRKILVDCYSTKGEAIIINYSKDRSDRETVLQYGIFLHLVCSRYPDAICDADYTYTFETNRPYFAYLFFYPNYKEAGYKTALDACKAIDESQKNIGDNAFYIHMGTYYEILEGRLSGAIIYKAGT